MRFPVSPKLNSGSVSEGSASEIDLKAIDALLKGAGLVTSRRAARSAERNRPGKHASAAADELVRPVPIPTAATNGVEWLPVPGWKSSWLWAGFSTRRGGLSRAYCAEDAPGELNLGFTAEDSRETVLANRRLLAEAVTGDRETPLAAVRQFHSNLTLQAGAADAVPAIPHRAGVPGDRGPQEATLVSCGGGGGWLAEPRPLGRRADGQITDQPGLLLAVLTADCIPVLVADRRRRVVGAFHAGWRGTVRRIVETGVGRMRLQYGSRPEDLIAAIGPGIGPCCYAVGEEVLSEFESQFNYAGELVHEVGSTDPVRNKYPMLFLNQRAPGHSATGPSLHLDLIEANRRQLLAAGLKARAIKVVSGCTQCHRELFFSHRGSRGHAGRMMAVIGIRPQSLNRRGTA